METDQVASESSAPVPVARARGFPWFAYGLAGVLGAVVLVCGLGLMYWWSDGGELGVVRKIRLSAKQGIDLKKIEEVLDTPDYYVEVITGQGSIRTETFNDTPLGGGMTFTPPAPVRLADISEVRVFDANALGKDQLVDRVDRPVWESAGEKFVFAMEGDRPGGTGEQKVGMILAVAGGVVLGMAVVVFVRGQVV